MNDYVYTVRDAANGNKLVGGTIHADSMEGAARRAVKRCKLTIRQHVFMSFADTDFIRDGRKVYLHIGAHAEYLLDSTSVKVIDHRTAIMAGKGMA
jgi:type IV secretory pathway ATPase VirB11/archaellum biosynthesis ATPase